MINAFINNRKYASYAFICLLVTLSHSLELTGNTSLTIWEHVSSMLIFSLICVNSDELKCVRE